MVYLADGWIEMDGLKEDEGRSGGVLLRKLKDTRRLAGDWAFAKLTGLELRNLADKCNRDFSTMLSYS